MHKLESLTVFDHVLALFLIVVLPLYGKFWAFPRMVAEIGRGDAGARVHAYTLTMIVQWAVVAILAAAWWKLGRSGASLGLIVPQGWRLWVAIALPLLAAAFMASQSAALATQPRLIEQARGQMGGVHQLLPHTAGELRVFIALAITAGICEEVLYRGFLIGYAARFMPAVVAVALTSVAFGFGHLYQGPTNAVRTGVVGLVMGLAYLAIGAVWPLMLVHAIVDIGGGLVGYLVMRTSQTTS